MTSHRAAVKRPHGTHSWLLVNTPLSALVVKRRRFFTEYYDTTYNTQARNGARRLAEGPEE